MTGFLSRRDVFKKTLASSPALLGIGDLLSRLPPVAAAAAKLSGAVQFDPSIEPLVRLLEDTPREKLLEKVAVRIRHDTSYQDVLTALLLAGVRNVQPRPAVGFKFHCVLVVNSAHLASLASPPAERWLPIFWALDYFKNSQARDVEEGNWTMTPVKEFFVPDAPKAHASFVAAMDNWNEYGADASVAALARTAGASEIYEIFWRYGMRDFRSIGHKAIFVANSWRTLNCIGWRHAEPVLRSLTYALLNHEGDNPANRDAPADRPWRRNIELVKTIRSDWCAGKPEPAATKALLTVLREGSDQDASEKTAELLNHGVAAQSIWDALFAASGELVLRQAGIVALHAVTTTNAIHYAYLTSANDETRRLAMLQNAAFLPLFREAMKGRGPVGNGRIDTFEAEFAKDGSATAIGQIFAEATNDRSAAVRKALGHLDKTHQPRALMDTARRLIFLKGDDAHDYKFSSAVLEDYYHISPGWRDRFLASSLALLRSSGEPNNRLIERARSALVG